VRGVVSQSEASARVKRWRAPFAGAIAAALAACSLTMPFEDRQSALKADRDVTGSITPRQAKTTELPPGQMSPFSPKLDDEDWRRQRAALATALDPQGNGGQVSWENGASGHRGIFGATGDAFLVKDDICRIFKASVTAGEPEQWFQGTACRVAAGDWAIRDISPSKHPG
jgi:surface antigen